MSEDNVGKEYLAQVNRLERNKLVQEYVIALIGRDSTSLEPKIIFDLAEQFYNEGQKRLEKPAAGEEGKDSPWLPKS